MKQFLSWVIISFCLIPTVYCDISVDYTINTETGQAPISPYIYGTNFQWADATISRSGGNRLTGYNWENNYSNAGSDWYHHSDRYLVRNLLAAQQTIPGIMLNTHHDAALSQGQESIVTLQMAGYVSADDSGTVDYADRAPSARWKEVVYAKGAPFCSPYDNPDTSDNYVYMDECVNFLVNEYGNASTATGVKFYCLDNEPALWSNGEDGATHPRLHPAKPTCVELRDKSIALSAAVKDVDPYAQILGPALYGFAAYLHFQGASDWDSVKGSHPWFISWYLDEMAQAEVSAGRRLLDALDVHWYPEAQDGAGNRITNGSVHTNEMYTARMQAPRTLWDTGYIYPNITYPDGEVSWINQWYFAQYLPLLTRLNNDIATHYPGTKLAITEYAYGAGDHWSGGIATADVLGIFGKYGVHIATYWKHVDDPSYVNAAINMYRNYDGSGSTFGDTKVTASMNDKVNSSIYASTFADDQNTLTMVVLNKHLTEAIAGTFTISSPRTFGSARVWAFDSGSSTITERASVSSITGNTFSYTIPALTACVLVLETECSSANIDGTYPVQLNDFVELAADWGLSGADLLGDINNDGTVNGTDLTLMATYWLSDCNP